MKNSTIKTKLIALFIVIKVIPLLMIAYIAYEGVKQLEEYVNKSTRVLFDENKEIINTTANASIEDSIKYLDKTSQTSLEKVSYEMANKVAGFLYERDKDLLFLSEIPLTQKVLESFYATKNREVTQHEEYKYNAEKQRFEPKETPERLTRNTTKALLKDNEKEFNYIDPVAFKTQSLPLYKEVSFFDLEGNEIYKVSTLNAQKVNVFNPLNTYVNAESYFKEAKNLKKGEIYVSDVIGEYVSSKIIGTFTQEKAQKAGIAFEPEKHGYAGVENPFGKRFEGIVRFITAVYKDHQKIGYLSLALDHKHLKEFMDTSNPTGFSSKQNIADASLGNYAFMWDYEGKSIVHPRDYSIVGYDKNTGKLAMPWLSLDIAEKFYASNQPIDEFLKQYPLFQEQSLEKKPNLRQLKEEGLVGLDCRYLNFAPQCQGWMQLTQHGGYGSFIINWSNVWKLTTAATIPYFTGKYKDSPRGFGFVSIGANVDDFHAAANETKKHVDLILETQTNKMRENLDQNSLEITLFIQALINELSVVTFIMIMLIISIAIWMSNYMTSKINNLLKGTKKFANKELDYRIKVSSNDEIGNLESSFNQMASEINSLILKQQELNEKLEDKVNEKTKELIEINQNLERVIEQRTKDLKQSLIKAQNSDKVKSTFLANMSHEIRTPLNAIIGFSELLSMNEEIDDESRKQALIVEDSAKLLLGIINDILDISKIESGNFEIKLVKTSLENVCQNVFELFTQKAEEKQIALLYEFDKKTPSFVMADALRIEQVLNNLLANALKFTPNKGKIELKVLILEKNHTHVRIRFSVIDTGIGIAKNNLNKIFEPFIQADDESNRKYEGTGLGLSICQHIVHAFNSHIKIQSQQDVGSEFWFDVAFEMCEDNNNLLSSHTLVEKQKKITPFIKGKILVVEDNKLNKVLIKYFLHELKAEFVSINSSHDALEAYKKEAFELILMDMPAPFLKNLEAYTAIRAYEKANDKPCVYVLAMIGAINEQETQRLLSLGINACLKKPLSFDAFKASVLNGLNQKNEPISVVQTSEVQNIQDATPKLLPLENEVIFDKEETMRQLGLDESTVDMLLDNFFLTLAQDLQKLQEALTTANSEKIVHAAHYLKSACGNLVMKEAALILDTIEKEAKEGKTVFNQGEFEALNTIFENIKVTL